VTLEPSPKRLLGQHFLRDRRVVERLLEAVGNVPSDWKICEIGPGSGAMTLPLVEKYANKIILLEKDKDCLAYLGGVLETAGFAVERGTATEGLSRGDGRSIGGRPAVDARSMDGRSAVDGRTTAAVTLLEADALTVDWPALLHPGAVVVGNLPYNVGTEIVADLLRLGAAGAASPVRRMVFMLQKEVVQRLTAKPGGKQWGRLGVLADLLCERRVLFDVAPGAFYPPPQVMSTVVELVPLPRPRFEVDMGRLDALLRRVFGQRRKMLRASLRGLVDAAALEKLGIAPTERPERLDTAALCRLASAL
jgi:16S rRNA (adenine1518-N6/adenine1519-N6)-dimethyltransferase